MAAARPGRVNLIAPSRVPGRAGLASGLGNADPPRGSTDPQSEGLYGPARVCGSDERDFKMDRSVSSLFAPCTDLSDGRGPATGCLQTSERNSR